MRCWRRWHGRPTPSWGRRSTVSCRLDCCPGRACRRRDCREPARDPGASLHRSRADRRINSKLGNSDDEHGTADRLWAGPLTISIMSWRCSGPSGSVVADRPEEGAVVVDPVPGPLWVVVDQRVGAGVQRHRVFSPLPLTRRCGTPRRACRKSRTLSLPSSSRRSAWKSRVERIARSRLSLI